MIEKNAGWFGVTTEFLIQNIARLNHQDMYFTRVTRLSSLAPLDWFKEKIAGLYQLVGPQVCLLGWIVFIISFPGELPTRIFRHDYLPIPCEMCSLLMKFCHLRKPAISMKTKFHISILIEG